MVVMLFWFVYLLSIYFYVVDKIYDEFYVLEKDVNINVS